MSSNPFNWKGQPSVTGATYSRGKMGDTGKTRSQVATEVNVERTKKLGRNPGTIAGLAPEHKAKKRAPGHYRG